MAKVTYVLRVVRSTIAAETLWLSDGCDVSIYINKLSESLLEHGKRREVIAYTDNRSFYDAERLLVDIVAVIEIVERNEINITWIEKEKQIGDILKKSGAPSEILWDMISSSKMNEL